MSASRMPRCQARKRRRLRRLAVHVSHAQKAARVESSGLIGSLIESGRASATPARWLVHSGLRAMTGLPDRAMQFETAVSHAPRHPQSAVRRSGGAEGHRAGAGQAAAPARRSTGSSISSSICRPAGSTASGSTALDEADVGRTITVALTARDYRQSGGRGPFRIFAEDGAGNYVTLTYFNNPGWGKKQLPLGETRIVSGKLDRYGQELQIVHPDYVLKPAEAAHDPGARAGLSAVRRAHQPSARRPRRPGAGAEARARRMDRAEPQGAAGLARLGARRWRPRIAIRPPPRRASGSPMTRCSPTSWR